jgi:hypothetical protein
MRNALSFVLEICNSTAAAAHLRKLANSPNFNKKVLFETIE